MILYQSNRLENLFKALAAIIADKPLSDPMVSEIIVVQHHGIGRWLCRQIADRFAICANLEFPLPASFFWRVLVDTMAEPPAILSFERETLIWQIMTVLEESSHEPALAEISGYLKDDRDGRKIFQLSGQLADLFDQYQLYRPDMLLTWEQGSDNQWQAHLWRRLVSAQPAVMHRGSLIAKFINDFEADRINKDNLPERVCFFGFNMLAPVYLSLIDKISQLTQVHFFHFSPCAEYWEDLTSERLLAIKRKTWRQQRVADLSSYFNRGNPLLASLGMVAREFSGLLMEYEPHTIDLYSQPDKNNLLAFIQGDILNLQNRDSEKIVLSVQDKSIRFHCCHSPVREVQVLHDRLLDLFNQDPELKPSDILVMAPDINEYAPLINGVFAAASENMRIPWSVKDLSPAGTRPVIDGFLAILKLADSRFGAGEVLVLLENPAIMRNFNLDDNQLCQLRTAISRAGIRWGLNSGQRRKFVDDDSELHSWQAGLDRLLLTFMTGAGEVSVGSILPVDFLLPDADELIGILADFFTELKWLYNALNSSHPVQVWLEIFREILIKFFAGCNDSSDLDEMITAREFFADLSCNCTEAGFTGRLTLAVIRQYSQARLTETTAGGGMYTGRVSFSNMVPMRSLPFKVIYLLGMNDGSFPCSNRPPGFDLIAENPRLGDRSRRDDDRYLFLEALLSARSHFIISWVGRSRQDNSEQPPSVVVSELIDYIDQGWETPEAQAGGQQLIIEYPLQPFAHNCFDGSSQFASYAELWLPAPERSKRSEPTRFINQSKPLSPLLITEIDIAQLVRFWQHPVRFFLEQRLGMRLIQYDGPLPESELFDHDNLQKYNLTRDIMTRLLANKDQGFLYDKYLNSATLPREPFASLVFDRANQEAAELLKELDGFLNNPVQPEIINLEIAGITLNGELSSLYGTGRFYFRPAKLKSKDILSLWVQHLVLLLCRPAGVPPVSRHRASDRLICFQEVDKPATELEKLIDLFRRGLAEPLHFYPQTSLAFAEAKPELRLSKAEKTWYSRYYRGEEEEPGYKLAMEGVDPLDDQFAELAQKIFTPILNNQHG